MHQLCEAIRQGTKLRYYFTGGEYIGCYYDNWDNRFVFNGSPTGSHELDARPENTDDERLIRHWEGYINAATARRQEAP